jgi:hypothetical protein
MTESTDTTNMFAAGVATASQEETEAPIEHPEFDKEIGNLQAKIDMKAEEIRQNTSLDEGAKSRQMQQLWNEAMEAKGVLERRYEQQLSEQVAEAEQKVFHVTASERDSLRAAYADVYDRVIPGLDSGEPEGIQYAREELDRLMKRAVRTGDRPLEHAAGQLAIERGIDAVRDSYLARSPEKTRAWDEYNTAARRLANFTDPQERMWRNLTSAAGLKRPSLKPPEAPKQ